MRTSLSMYVGEQARGEPRVLRLLDDQRRRGLDRELVQLARGRAVVEAADGLGRDAHRVDVGQARRSSGSTARTILLTSTGSRRAVALAHAHRRLRVRVVRGLVRRDVARRAGALVALASIVSLSIALLLVRLPAGVKAPCERRTGEACRPRSMALARGGALGPTRLPRGFQVEPAPDVSRRRMLAGLRARERSGVAGFLLSTASQPRRASALWWRSFSLTAAGQPRILTGFPFQPGRLGRAPARSAIYWARSGSVNQILGSGAAAGDGRRSPRHVHTEAIRPWPT